MECLSLILRCLLLSMYFVSVICWDNEDLEIFDLVEEVNTNFYQLLEVQEDSNITEIKKAYRRLSLNIHPDKSDAPDAEIKFRQLVAVYDVLRDNNKRARYDLVLKNGLPNWHEAVYYYRRVRKMGLAEMLVILFVIITLGQYIVSWADYLEKKYFAEQFMSTKLKKIHKKQKKAKTDGALPQEPIIEIPSPSILDILPIQLMRFVWFCVTMLPHCYGLLRDYWEEWRQRSEEEVVMEEDDFGDDGGREKRVRRRKVFALPELKENERMEDSDETSNNCTDESEAKPVTSGTAPVSGGLWTEDDLTELVKQIKRHPPGTIDRWEKIAAAMFRSVPEVTFMARKVKEEGYRVCAIATPTPGPVDGVLEGDSQLEKPRKIKTKGGKLGKVQQEVGENDIKKDTSSNEEETNKNVNSTPNNAAPNNPQQVEVLWSQVEQKALENALIKYPKGTLERWDKIAKCVPGKGKEECMLRYKLLVELVKKRKETQDKPPETEKNVETKDTNL